MEWMHTEKTQARDPEAYTTVGKSPGSRISFESNCEGQKCPCHAVARWLPAGSIWKTIARGGFQKDGSYTWTYCKTNIATVVQRRSRRFAFNLNAHPYNEVSVGLPDFKAEEVVFGIPNGQKSSYLVSV